MATRKEAHSPAHRLKRQGRDTSRRVAEGASKRETSHSTAPDSSDDSEKVTNSFATLTKENARRILEGCAMSCERSESVHGHVSTAGPSKAGTFYFGLTLTFPHSAWSAYNSLLALIEKGKH